MTRADRPPRLLISFAPGDVHLKDALCTHLAALSRTEAIRLWSVADIPPGANSQDEFSRALADADIALLLLSAEYLASAPIQDVEIPQLLQRQLDRGLRIVPIIARTCSWRLFEWLRALAPLPRSGTALASQSGDALEQCLTDIVGEIAALSRAIGPSGAEAQRPADPSVALYSHLVSTVATLLDLDNWSNWTRGAVAPDMRWRGDWSDRLFSLHRKLNAAVWPGTIPELESSMNALFQFTYSAFDLFSEHSHLAGEGVLVATKFYQIPEWDPARYEALSQAYGAWQDACVELVREATRAANWFAATVRRHLNPMFFLLEGKFQLLEGPFQDLSFTSIVYEYSDVELEMLCRDPKEPNRRVSELKKEYLTTYAAARKVPKSGA
ncbi:toll/interleukin-1 receptor domain-containing protein [Sorangium sp. So ce134]